MKGESPFRDRKERTSLFIDKHILSEDYTPDNILRRDEEIDDYANLLEDVFDGWCPENIFVYGKTGVGKTIVSEYMMEWLDYEVEEQNQETLEEHLEDHEDLELDSPITDAPGVEFLNVERLLSLNNEVTPETPIVDIDISAIAQVGNDDFVNFHPYYINCNKHTSTYQIIVTLANKIAGEEIASFGMSTGDVWKRLYSKMDEKGGIFIIVFDEIENVGEDESLLYEFPRARKNGDLENSRVSIIGISNDLKYRENLSPKIKDSLCEDELLFPPYDANDLRVILEQRAKNAIKDGVLEEDAIPLAAAFTAGDKGSARQAIDILRESVKLAQKEGDSTVTEEHVRNAKDYVDRGQIDHQMEQLTTHAKISLLAVVKLANEGQTPARTKKIHQAYKHVCRTIDADPYVRRAVHDHLAEMAMLGLLEASTINKGRSGGRANEYDLDVEVGRVLRSLRTDSRVADYIDDNFFIDFDTAEVEA